MKSERLEYCITQESDLNFAHIDAGVPEFTSVA